MNFAQNIYSQCQPAVADDIFPGWQWRFVNPITKQEDEEYQPFNTSLPTCSKYIQQYYKFKFRILLYVICSLIFAKNSNIFQ